MLRNRDGKKIIGATTLALGLLFVATVASSWLRTPKRLEGDSASSLVPKSFDGESEQLKEQAQNLGSYVSTEAMAAQRQRIRFQMQDQGATAETADAVLTKAASWENSFEGALRPSLKEPLWPLAAKAAVVKNKEVWVVFSGYYYPEKIADTGWCGTISPYHQMAYRICVVENKAPNRCWVTSITYKISTPEERKDYILDEPDL